MAESPKNDKAVAARESAPHPAPNNFWERITSWAAIGPIVLALAGIGVGVMSITPPEFEPAKWSFASAAAILLIKLGHELMAVGMKLAAKIIFFLVAVGSAGGCLAGAWHWIDDKEMEQRALNNPESLANAVVKKIQEQQALSAGVGHVKADVEPCRSDKLANCSDEQLFQWGESLNDRILEIARRFGQTSQQARDTQDATLRAGLYRIGITTFASDFWDCCAIDSLLYFDELKFRLGGGARHNKTTDWLRGFVKSPVFGEKSVTDTDGLMSAVAWLELYGFHLQLERKIKAAKGQQ